MNRTIAAILLVTVLGAGCSPTPTSTVTPAPIWTPTPTLTPTPTPTPLSNFELRRDSGTLRMIMNADWGLASALYNDIRVAELGIVFERIIDNGEKYLQLAGAITHLDSMDQRLEEFDNLCIRAMQHEIKAAEHYLEFTRTGDAAEFVKGDKEFDEANILWDQANLRMAIINAEP